MFETLGNIVISVQKKNGDHLHDLHGSSDHFAKFVFHKRLILKRELYEKQR